MNNQLLNRLRLFSFRNLMLEKDLERIENSGIDIGHLKTLESDELVDIEFFESDIRKSAQKMADFYVYYYSLENTIRRTIAGILKEKYGVNWWHSQVNEDIKKEVNKRIIREKDSVLDIRSEDPLTYTNFSELIVIVEDNWNDFSDIIRSAKAMRQILTQFNLIRNVIAHSNELSDNDISRLQLLLKDWFKIQV